ncbi:MAG: tRNA lysidine(34) synthetase TilS [Alphaproteobacteria bacterium]|nr:MAG: tRNA lysidine(34) synthetase TilS [Alphaproteobacteria bacterium]
MAVKPKLALAVSGGKDSMGMVYALKDLPNIVVLTVDHRLREESAGEALQVQRWMMELNVPHVILTWEHDGIDTDIQNKARTARYDLMTQWCWEHGVKYLMTAHHREDQIETFFMRLAKGSGLKGLGVMHDATTYNNITILRPFLSVPKKTLHNYIEHENFIEDPSNQNEAFERIRFRSLVKDYIKLDPDANILKTIDKLKMVDEYLDGAIQDISVDKLLELDYVLFERVINSMFQDDYPFKSRKIKGLYERLHDPEFKATTFANHLFKKTKAGLEIVKEEKM